MQLITNQQLLPEFVLIRTCCTFGSKKIILLETLGGLLRRRWKSQTRDFSGALPSKFSCVVWSVVRAVQAFGLRV